MELSDVFWAVVDGATGCWWCSKVQHIVEDGELTWSLGRQFLTRVWFEGPKRVSELLRTSAFYSAKFRIEALLVSKLYEYWIISCSRYPFFACCQEDRTVTRVKDKCKHLKSKCTIRTCFYLPLFQWINPTTDWWFGGQGDAANLGRGSVLKAEEMKIISKM